MSSTKGFRYEILDVFAESPYSGNPLAVVHGAAALDTTAMQAIAREMNLSETAFVLHDAARDLLLRDQLLALLLVRPELRTVLELADQRQATGQGTHGAVDGHVRVANIPDSSMEAKPSAPKDAGRRGPTMPTSTRSCPG